MQMKHDIILESGAWQKCDGDTKTCLPQLCLAPGPQCQASEPGPHGSAGPPPLLQDALTS